MMYDREKSDLAIVAVKPTNKAGQPAAELVEPRAGARGMRVSKARAGHRTGEPCHRRWSAYGKLQGKGRRRSSPRSSITSVLITSQRHSLNSRRMPQLEWMG